MRLNGKIILRGKGLHSGKECEVIIEPYDTPEVLMRSGSNELPLRKFRLNGTNRGSDYIYPDGSAVRTCEHVLSGLAGLGVWSGVRLTVSGGEMPALDGCSSLVCEKILASSEAVSDETQALEVREPVIIYGTNPSRFIAAFPCDELRVSYTVEYEFIGAQVFGFTWSPDRYHSEISGARTFAMESEVEYLRSHGMALGGTLDNAIVIGETIRASGGLRWSDEFVRHKVLDLTGDLAAIGRPLKAHIIAMKAGHELHLRLAEKLRGD